MRLVELILIFLIASTQRNAAQNAYRQLDDFDVNARINSDGILFRNPGAGAPGWEFPKGSGKHSLASSGLWIGGFDQAGALHFAAQTYRYGLSDFWCGPLQAQSGAPFSSMQWDALWAVQSSDIDFHRQNFAQPGYVMPDGIQEWPGSSYQGVQQIIAPFADTDNNGQYNPAQGDYPLINGDDAVYFVFNDLYGTHTQSSGIPLGVEVYALVYQVNSTESALRNTVFVRYRIRNRSVFDYSNLRLGIFADFDIGNPYDDIIGTRVDRHLIYAENGDSVDGNGMSGEYGLYSPSCGVTLLSHDAAHSIAWTNNSQATGNPSNFISSEYYNLISGRWRDGNSLTFGGSGYQSGTVNADFIFPGDSDPATAGQIWNCNNPDDYRGLISTGPLSLPSGGFLTFEVAYTCALGLPGQSSLLMFDYVDRIRMYHQSQVNETVERKKSGFSIYPNPCEERVYFDNSVMTGETSIWFIMDLGGRVVTKGELGGHSGSMDVSGLKSGLYLFCVYDNKGQEVFREKLLRR
ncbi:MAG: hypothetical protein RLZZ46_1358 [Bacteroidota bacterium]|jgi:hypothetical protein